MRIVLILLTVLIIGPATALAQDKVFNSESFTLENGMEVVVVPNHRVPVVTHMVWYRVGSGDEEPGKSGLAHFVEHLMFKGTEKVPAGEFSKRVKALGGNDNAFTSYDFTAYFQSISREHLETVMEMEADRMTNLVFPAEDVNSERLVVIEERRQRTENDPRGYFGEQMRSTLFVNHPYGNPVIGWLHEMDALNRDDVMAFYKKWYMPNNAILIVSGDVTAKELKPLAEKTYGKIPARDVPERNWTSVPPLLANSLLTMHHETIRQPYLNRMLRAPSRVENREEALALELLNSIMSDGATSRFYKSLVFEQKIATSAGMGYSSDKLGGGIVYFNASPAEGHTLDEMSEAIDIELRKLLKDGVTEEEMKDHKTRMIDAAIFARDSLSGPAMLFGQTLTTGGTIDDLETWPALINAVTAEQILDVARKYLDPDKNDKRPYVQGYVLPPETTGDTEEAQEAQ